MNRVYAPELKAQVIAETLLGGPIKALARKHGIPEATIRSWRNQAKAQPVIAPQKRDDLGELVYEYLAVGLKALISQSEVMGDPEWFKGQGPTAHFIHGVLADKLVIIFGGVERGNASVGGEAEVIP